MKFWNLFFPKEISIKQIEDFYTYSEVAKCTGRSDNTKQFGSIIDIINTRENTKTVYHGILLCGSKKWGFISVENEKVKYQYTEDDNLNHLAACPVTTDKETIAILTKNFLKWYHFLKLPKSIQDIQNKEQDTVSVLREIDIDGFDEKHPPVLRVLSNKTTLLVFGVFPPRNKKITKQQADCFDKLLADATGKKVIQDDRELFVIFDDSQKMIDDIISFLQKL